MKCKHYKTEHFSLKFKFHKTKYNIWETIPPPEGLLRAAGFIPGCCYWQSFERCWGWARYTPILEALSVLKVQVLCMVWISVSPLPPAFLCWNPNAQCDKIMRGLWDARSQEGGALTMGLMLSLKGKKKKSQRPLLPLGAASTNVRSWRPSRGLSV